jgi:putative membrane-bound dehydrogenase-like protein
MVYYDQPTKLATGLEQQIVGAVERQIGKAFAAPAESRQPQGAQAMTPQQSLAAIRTNPGLKVELVAAEPLVVSPVAIDFGPDGKLWVAEMYDYPQGLDGRFQPGGRVRLLESTKDDGQFDKATVFLEGIPFPTGVTVWRKGVLVCAAPDILYAEDTDADGKAEVVRKLFSGFGTDNYQARVNSLEYGLDGWVYGSCGLFGGRITNDAGKPAVALGDRDFRIKPDEGIIEPATGRTQQGRVRDDWGNWFGCDNSNFVRHYPLADHDLRRNPHFAHEVTSVSVPDGPEANRLYPISAQLQMFKLSGPTGRATAACGLGIYRDELLGREYTGNAFTCEPVNLVVHRLRLEPKGFSFVGHRSAEEANSEFVASSDTWFRPVQARTGPDGALWIVDMHRYVIKHPRWIPPEELAKVDVRAGHDMGRIFRVRPANQGVRPWNRLDKLGASGLIAALDTPNGWQCDMAMQMLRWKGDLDSIPSLRAKALSGRASKARLAALCVLDAQPESSESKVRVVRESIADSSSNVRCNAIRLAATFVNDEPEIATAIMSRLDDADPQVRLQVACSLGSWRDPRAGEALGTILMREGSDPILTAAVFSSLTTANVGGFAARIIRKGDGDQLSATRLDQAFRIIAALGDKPTLSTTVESLTTPVAKPLGDWQLDALTGILDALARRDFKLSDLLDPFDHSALLERMIVLLPQVNSSTESDSRRIKFIKLLVRLPEVRAAMRRQLPGLLTPEVSPILQAAAVAGLTQIGGDETKAALTANWRSYTPALKTQVINALFSREAWQIQLLQEVPASDIDATRRQQLLTSKNEKIRSLAEVKFAGAPSADRKKVLDDYRDVAGMTGNRERGRAVFLKTCSVCHELGNAGHHVGPDLAAVVNKTPQYLLQEILDPNRNVDSRYVSYVAVTKEGRSHTGLLASESAGSISLKAQEGKLETILRSEIDELQSTGVSLMPVGLEKDLSKQNLADVITYLATAGPPPKNFAGNDPVIITPVDGALALRAANAEIYGNEIAFESPFGNIGYWHGPRDHVVWTIDLESAGKFDVWLDWACDNGVAGNRFAIAAGAEELRGTIQGTGGWDQYHQQKIGTLSLPAGALRFSLRPDGERVNGALMDLRGVHLVAAGKMPVLAQAAAAIDADPAMIARVILEDSRPAAEREKLIRDHLGQAAELVAAMAAELPVPADEKEEYRRIPWIWRVAIAAGKKNETESLRKLLAASLPKVGEPLRDWQAVVVGGGIINGISQQGVWPGERMQELLNGETDLVKRWQQTLSLAATMADNEKVKTGTRYDALRIIPLAGWKSAGGQLTKYLQKGIDDELHMGAISGISDVDAPEVAGLLAAAYAHFNPGNRSLAIDALLRTEARAAVLVEALENEQIKPGDFKEAQSKKLREVKDDKLRARAEKILGK